jgi:hypothetical protein
MARFRTRLLIETAVKRENCLRYAGLVSWNVMTLFRLLLIKIPQQYDAVAERRYPVPRYSEKIYSRPTSTNVDRIPMRRSLKNELSRF